MPGLVGIVTKRAPSIAYVELERMVQTIRHESFYVSGSWADESMGLYVGWAERRGSFCDTGPFPLTNHQTGTTLLFSGEDYTESTGSEHLAQRGHEKSSGGPLYLLNRYEGASDFFESLDGMFHGLVVDRRRGSATLFNDRYGMHRLYFYESGEAFYFSAEAKAILAVCPETREIDPSSLGEFISCGCVLENRTIFTKIHLVPPAAMWTFCNASLERKEHYFHPQEWENQEPLNADDYYRQIRDVFVRRLPVYFSGRERVAVALTGGLDTRVIMAWRNAAPNTLPCYTFGGTLRESQDVRIARDVARVCRQRHNVITVGKEFLSRFPHYAERTAYLGEGCITVSNAPDLYISELARQIAPAKIVGTWGSELLRQAVTFKPSNAFGKFFHSDLLTYITRAQATYQKVRQTHPVTFAAFRQTPWQQYGIESLEQTFLTIRSPYLSNEFVRTVYQAPSPGGADVRLRLIADGNPSLAAIYSDRGVGATSSSFRLWVSRLLQEFTFKAEYAYDSGMPQWLARVDHSLSPLRLDSLFLGRHKFLHFRVWYRDQLADYVKQILLDPATLSRPFLVRNKVETTVRQHIRGERNHTVAIHSLLTLELLHRMFT